jgi:hypothetical protein
MERKRPGRLCRKGYKSEGDAFNVLMLVLQNSRSILSDRFIAR